MSGYLPNAPRLLEGANCSHAVTRCISDCTDTLSRVCTMFAPSPDSFCVSSHTQVPVFLAVRGLSDSKWASVVDSFRAEVLALTTNSTGNGGGGLCACLFAACASSPEAERQTTLDACRAWLVRGFLGKTTSLFSFSLFFSPDLSLSLYVFFSFFLVLSSCLVLSLCSLINVFFKEPTIVACRWLKLLFLLSSLI